MRQLKLSPSSLRTRSWVCRRKVSTRVRLSHSEGQAWWFGVIPARIAAETFAEAENRPRPPTGEWVSPNAGRYDRLKSADHAVMETWLHATCLVWTVAYIPAWHVA